MNNLQSCGLFKKTTSDPSSRNYSKEVNNKEHEKSPYGTDEPSTNTTYK